MEIFDALVRLMVNLTIPRECIKNNEGRQTEVELASSLMRTKGSFRDPRTTNIIMVWLERLIGGEKMTKTEQFLVKNCFLLVRNLLYIPEMYGDSNHSDHNQIVWNLFSKNLNTVILDSIDHDESSHWVTSVVQLMALVYKDQHVESLHKGRRHSE